MWKVFPKFGMLKIILLIFSALFLSSLILLLKPVIVGDSSLSWDNFGVALGLATPVTMIFIGIIYSIGKWVWIPIWKIPLLKKVLNTTLCPNLNGIWLGEIESNFKDNDGNGIKKEVELEIKADLFGFDISLRSKDDYQSSKVVQSEIYKDPRTGVFYISYIFESNVPIPKELDDRVFDGAAKLEVKFEDNKIILKGIYWTNRAWQRKQNTAGIITVCKNS